MREDGLVTELEELAHRLEQQVSTYERMHVEELERFRKQWDALLQIQSDELRMLRDELNQLKQEIVAMQTPSEPTDSPVQVAQPVELTITRRDFITGNYKPHAA